MKKIAIEEHFYTQNYVAYLMSRRRSPRLEITEDQAGSRYLKIGFLKYPASLLSALLDLGEGRLKQMDESGIDMQVLSLGNPGVEAFDASTGKRMARETNDELSQVIQKYPDRFSGFAAIPAQEPESAADELERAVKKLGLKGAKITSHVRGEFLDNKKYWVIFERAENLGVPIYLHPNIPPPDMIKPYLTYTALVGSMLGFAHETGLHAMRLICSGVFDKYPDLKIILGHLGEALPYWLQRMDTRWIKEGAASDPISSSINKRPSEYFRHNFLVTTSGMPWQPALICTYLSLGADRMLFSIDYPFESNQEMVEFIDAAPICDIDKAKMYHANAEKLLGL